MVFGVWFCFVLFVCKQERLQQKEILQLYLTVVIRICWNWTGFLGSGKQKLTPSISAFMLRE